MAGKTRRSQVRAIEFVLRFGVVFNGKNAAQKPVGGMALRAIRTDGIHRKLLIVIVFMAIRTTFKRHRIGHFFAGVALFAIHRNVFTLEGEGRFVVVEFVQIPCFTPAAFVVTIHAFGPESAFVYVFVAGFTGGSQHTQSILENIERRGGIHFMAFPAIHFLVFALERKMRFAVVKFPQTALIGKRLGIVAFLTIDP